MGERPGRAVEEYVLRLIERDAAGSEGGPVIDASGLLRLLDPTDPRHGIIRGATLVTAAQNASIDSVLSGRPVPRLRGWPGRVPHPGHPRYQPDARARDPRRSPRRRVGLV